MTVNMVIVFWYSESSFKSSTNLRNYSFSLPVGNILDIFSSLPAYLMILVLMFRSDTPNT